MLLMAAGISKLTSDTQHQSLESHSLSSWSQIFLLLLLRHIIPLEKLLLKFKIAHNHLKVACMFVVAVFHAWSHLEYWFFNWQKRYGTNDFSSPQVITWNSIYREVNNWFWYPEDRQKYCCNGRWTWVLTPILRLNLGNQMGAHPKKAWMWLRYILGSGHFASTHMNLVGRTRGSRKDLNML